MGHAEKIPLWWKIWLGLTLVILVGLFILKTFWVALFGASAFLFFGAGILCGRSDKRMASMATAFYFLLFVFFLVGFLVVLC